MNVWIYTDRRGDKDNLIVFDSEATANAWLSKHDPDGVAFEYPVLTTSTGFQTQAPIDPRQ
jgi:hypothetical protein